MRKCWKKALPAAALGAALVLGVGPAQAAHPDIPLMTYEELALQFTGGQSDVMPVMIDPNSGQGMPYSPKATCGAASCHDGSTVQPGGGVLDDYETIIKGALHAANGMHDITDTIANGTTIPNHGDFDASKGKPWNQSTGMFGKW